MFVLQWKKLFRVWEYSERRKLLEKIVKEDDFAKHVPMTVVKTETRLKTFLKTA